MQDDIDELIGQLEEYIEEHKYKIILVLLFIFMNEITKTVGGIMPF